ncbi:MAG TPA: hypothetical protein VF253_10160, partial [Candidatus Limnocylindrales bacterium]
MSAQERERPLAWNVAGLLGDTGGAVRTFDVADVTIDLPEDLELAAPIAGQVRLSRTNRGILAEARLATSLAGECARCLRPLTTPIDIVLE